MSPAPFSSAPMQTLPISPAFPNPFPMSPTPFPPGPTSPRRVSSTLIRPDRPASLPRRRKHEEDKTPSFHRPQKIQPRDSASRKRKATGQPVAPSSFPFGRSNQAPSAPPGAVPASGEEPMDCTPAPDKIRRV
nr:vegetative cell wall protein gp1-like [Pogona vitticeps]